MEVDSSVPNYVGVDKELLTCIICLDTCHNAMETNCCHTLICESCVNILIKLSNKCPICRNSTLFTPSIITRKIISTIREKCPVCKITLRKSELFCHIKTQHTLTQELILKYDIKIFEDNLPDRINNLTHLHELILSISDKGFKCRGKSFFNKCCDDKNIYNYKCNTCNITYCILCAKTNKDYFESKCHTHVLKYTVRDNGWLCDGGDCKSGFNRFHKSYGFRRFRCQICDFDLCEHCLEHSLK